MVRYYHKRFFYKEKERVKHSLAALLPHLTFIFNLFFRRITDKKDKNNSETTLHHRVTKSSSSSHSAVTKSNSNPLKHHQDSIVTNNTASSNNKDRKGSLSDCSTTSTSSRKNSEVCIIPEEKPESKAKEPQETPPKRAKRKTHDTMSRSSNLKFSAYQEPQEPKIVIEELSDPWEKQKLRQDHEDEKHKKSKRSKASHHKKETSHQPSHPGLEKKNSNDSSLGDEYEPHVEEKPFGFTTVENNKAKLKKHNSFPSASSSHTMDKLDEISLNGPKPDGKEYPKKMTKAEYTKSTTTNNSSKQLRPKKTPFYQEKERLMMDTPTSPHEIAAAIFDAALVKKSQQKKKNGKKPPSSKPPSRPNSSSSDLSSSSRSSSYSSIANEGKERARSATPSGSVQGNLVFPSPICIFTPCSFLSSHL